jgi:uncharacterized membrane protein YidH (DUF202 family)
MRNIFWENAVKNVVVVLALFTSYSAIENTLRNSPIASDKTAIGSFLVAVGILAVIACFGNFAFTYEKVELEKFRSRLLAHLTTGILMLVIGLSLEMTSVSSKLLIGNFFIFNLSLLLLYISSVLYDFWDLKRAHL